MEQVATGEHWFGYQALELQLIDAIQTSDEVLEKTVQTITDWKKVVAIAKDTPGFIVNRVARPFYSEALRIYEEGKADFATIDWAMKTIGGFRMGPFELMDFIAALEKALGQEAIKDFQPIQPGDVVATFADTARLEAWTGVHPGTSIDEGVRRFVEWYVAYFGNRSKA